MTRFTWNSDKNKLLKVKRGVSFYDRGEWESVNNVREEIQRYQAFATAMLETKRQVSVTLPLTDFEKVQQQASEAGMPYQALIADIVHRFVSGNTAEQSVSPQRA